MTILSYALTVTIGIVIGAVVSRLRSDSEIERLQRENDELLSAIIGTAEGHRIQREAA